MPTQAKKMKQKLIEGQALLSFGAARNTGSVRDTSMDTANKNSEFVYPNCRINTKLAQKYPRGNFADLWDFVGKSQTA